MAPPKAKPTPDPEPLGLWALTDIDLLTEALESVETALQGISAIKSVDVVLQFDEKVVGCHHDGQKWWVKFL